MNIFIIIFLFSAGVILTLERIIKTRRKKRKASACAEREEALTSAPVSDTPSGSEKTDAVSAVSESEKTPEKYSHRFLNSLPSMAEV